MRPSRAFRIAVALVAGLLSVLEADRFLVTGRDVQRLGDGQIDGDRFDGAEGDAGHGRADDAVLRNDHEYGRAVGIQNRQQFMQVQYQIHILLHGVQISVQAIDQDRLDVLMFREADRQIREELPGQDIRVAQEDDTFFLRGRVKDLASADRAFSIASTLGKAVNLLYVDVPAPEAQEPGG